MTPHIDGVLTCAGWSTWAAARTLIDGDACLWVDLRGAHHGPAPTQRPVGTHLWAWRPGRWVRVRIDGDRVLATVLTEGGGPGERVAGVVSEGVPWGDGGRAAPWSEPVTLLVTEGSSPLTFARVETGTR